MIKDTVGLWGIPVNRFRVFKAQNHVWHVIRPNKLFSSAKTRTGDEALEIVRQEIREMADE